MRLRKCRFVNIGPFVDWTIDLTGFRDDQKMIALVAPNGTGKSATVELSLLGAPYLNTPTQGTPAKRATAADSMLESTIVHGGHEWTLRHLFDAISGGGHSMVLKDGALVEKKANQTRFKAWAEQHLPPRSVVEASLFRFQKSEGFVEMEQTDRMSVLLRVIGVERLERKAAVARDMAKVEQKKLDEVLRQISEIRGDDPGLEVTEAGLRAATEAAAGADAAVATAKAALAAHQQAASDHALRKTSREAADKLVATLQAQAKGAADRRADAELKIKGNRQFQADAEAIRAAAVGLETANAELTRLELALVEADKQIAALLSPWRDARARMQAVGQRRAGAAQRLQDQAAVDKAVADLPTLVAAADSARAAYAAAEGELAALREKRWAGADERLMAYRAGYVEIAGLPGDRVDEAPGLARAGLTADDAAITAATETPVKIRALEGRLAVEKASLTAAVAAQASAEKLAARAADVASAKADLEAAEAEAAELGTGHAVAVLSAALRALGRLETARSAKALAAGLEITRKLASRLAALDDSERRIGELEGLVASAKTEEATAAEQIAAVELVEVGEAPNAAPLAQALSAAERDAAAAAAAVTKADLALARSREVAAKLEGKLAERAAIEAELSDWTRMALDHGRSGLQSDEVDAAGPALTGFINGCLRSCVGTRWAVSVETQQLDAKGQKLIDKLVIMVIDNKKGTRKEVKLHSGGERTTLAEAISSGLTMLGCKTAGFDRPTLVRDESTNFLDHEAAPLWIKMMRHVVEYTNADRLLFVSHNQAVVKLADAIIEVPEQQPVVAAETEAA